METNPKIIMNDAFNQALDIVQNRDRTTLPSKDAIYIAASNLAMALFSYEMSIRADPTDLLKQMLDNMEDEPETPSNG